MGLFRRRKPEPPPVRPAVGPVRLLSYQLAELQGLGKRERQEDASLICNGQDVTLMKQQGLLLAVADGMGGMADGDRMSRCVVSGLQKGFRQLDRSRSLGPQLKELAMQAGNDVFALGGGSGGSTLIAGMIYEERLDWVSVGDSFLFLLRQGVLVRINQDQTVQTDHCMELLEKGILDPAEANEDPEGSCLSSFLGMPELAREPEYSCQPMRLLPGDRLLLCSDGVAGVLTDQQLTACLLEPTPQQACRALDAAVQGEQRAYQDNYTALVLQAAY